MALALPRWIRAFDWPTLALILVLEPAHFDDNRKEKSQIHACHSGCAEIRVPRTPATHASTHYNCLAETVPTPRRGGTLAYLLKSTTTHVCPCSNPCLTIAPPHEQAPAHGTNSAARWHLPFQELSTHVLPCTNPRPLALLRTNKPSRAEWVAAVHHISVLMGRTRSLIAALPTPPTHLPPSVALRLPPFLGTRTRFEIKKGTGFFFDIHVKFVTDFPYCQVFDRQFFVLDVKQIRKSTISFGLLVQMEGKF